MLLTNSKHPFWEYSTNSSAKLILEDSTAMEGFHSLKITVHSISKPYQYKIEITYNNGNSEVDYLYKKDALNLIRNGWMKYYKDRTKMEIIKSFDLTKQLYEGSPEDDHRNVLSDSDSLNEIPHIGISRRKTSYDRSLSPTSYDQGSSPRSSCPGKGSPRWILMSKSQEGSPRSPRTPRRKTSSGSPRQFFRSGSEDSSPRSGSEESPRSSFFKRLSLKLSKSRSGPSSPEPSPKI